MARARLTATLAAAALALGTIASAQTPPAPPQQPPTAPPSKSQPEKTAKTDVQFVQRAAADGLLEVELGKTAQAKANHPDVKKFGQRMVTDHSKANDELETLAQQKGWQLPTEPDAKGKATVERLTKLEGAAFDRAYMREMVTDHEKAVSEFKKASTTAQDADLKAWAGKTLPTLEKHLQSARDLNKKLAAPTY